jgi:hypothetical protein
MQRQNAFKDFVFYPCTFRHGFTGFFRKVLKVVELTFPVRADGFVFFDF